MAWDLDEDRPIYAQLVTLITLDIMSGRYPPGERLPSVRELAYDAGVNPNTMQRALSNLEQSGLISTQRTTGKTVTDNRERIEDARKELAAGRTIIYLNDMEKLGYAADELPNLLTTLSKERNQ